MHLRHLKKQLDLPALMQLGFDFQIGGQQQFRAVHLDLDDADGIAPPLVAHSHPPPPGEARRPVRFGLRSPI